MKLQVVYVETGLGATTTNSPNEKPRPRRMAFQLNKTECEFI